MTIARRLLGDHKTILGFASGVCSAVLVTFVPSRVAWGGGLAVAGEMILSAAGHVVVTRLGLGLRVRQTTW